MGIGKIVLAGLFGLLPLATWAQHPDSTKTHAIREVQITAAKAETYAAGSRHTLIDSAFLKQNNAGSLAEVLQNATAVYVKTYGIATVSFRGTGASQTAVLWNGFNVNLPSLGLSDLTLIPVNSLGSVQLQHGSAGSTFGSAAIGGAILLASPSDIKPGFSLNAQQDFGSFGKYFSRLGSSYGFKKAGLSASVFRSEARNDFPFINFGKRLEKQVNAATAQTGFTADAAFRPSEKQKFFFRNWYTASDYQAQPGMLTTNTHARNQNRNLRSMAEWNYRSNWGNTTVKAAYFRDFMRYQDDNLKPSDTDISTWQAQAEHAFIIKEKLNLNLGADSKFFTGEVDGYSRPVEEWQHSVFALFRYDLFRDLHLNLNWRQAFIPGFNPPPAPTLGFSYDFLHQNLHTLSWKGNFTRGYRVPTLNDRYWPPGNPDLKPEDSRNLETGVKYTFSGNALTAETELTGYRMLVKNWIQWSPGTNGGLWSAQNLQEVLASGLEFSGKLTYRFSADLRAEASGNYAYTSSVQKATYQNTEPELLNKQLVYVPLHTASGLLQTSYKTWFLTLNGSFTGSRFPDAENEKTLPAYSLLHVYGGKTFTLNKYSFQVIGRVNNLTDVRYQNYQYYATPGRHYSLSLRFNFN